MGHNLSRKVFHHADITTIKRRYIYIKPIQQTYFANLEDNSKELYLYRISLQISKYISIRY